MVGKDTSYQVFNDDGDYEENQAPDLFGDPTDGGDFDEPDDDNSQEEYFRDNLQSMRFSKPCLKNFFTVLLIFVYLLLTTVAIFLAYQTISDFMEKLNHPVMSVTYKEVGTFAPPGIALYPGRAQLLSCNHYYHDNIPPLVAPGTPQEGDCVVDQVTYVGPFTNQTEKRALVVRGPADARNKELVFLQFSHNETEEDFSAITYMLFANFTDLIHSSNKSEFMRNCERNYSMWTFSGGFRTWFKMSLMKTTSNNVEDVEFRQESSVVKFNDNRPASEKDNQLFFAVFEWRDAFQQERRLIVTANAWSSIAILCGVFMALFKAANFAKLTVQWIIRMRRRHLKNKVKELNQIDA